MPSKSAPLPEQHRLFHYSYARCLSDRRFFPVFCQLFRAKCSPHCSLYKADAVRQARMLEISTISILQAGYSQEHTSQARELALVFANLDMALRAEDVQIWLDCLIEAVMMCDPTCNDLQIAAWRHSFLSGIQCLDKHMRLTGKFSSSRSGRVLRGSSTKEVITQKPD